MSNITHPRIINATQLVHTSAFKLGIKDHRKGEPLRELADIPLESVQVNRLQVYELGRLLSAHYPHMTATETRSNPYLVAAVNALYAAKELPFTFTHMPIDPALETHHSHTRGQRNVY
jgi:hypothetical protein